MDVQGNSRKFMFAFCLVAVLGLLTGSVPAEANIKMMKAYKGAFPGAKPKCLFCHVNKMPKKGDGVHEFNAYGLKVKSIDEIPTEETFKQAGTVEDFKAKNEEATGEEAVTGGGDKEEASE